jgi:pyruvate formate lyase activating enzyme
MLDRSVTPHETLLAARQAGRAAGLRYVYIGNASGPGFGDTLCPACQALALGREGFLAGASGLLNGGCTACGAPIPGVWA